MAEAGIERASEHYDVLIVGAGISGIDAAWHLQRRCPGKSWAILEARERIGGTWDLFRFPGIRSDSDMYTLGFPFRPWRGDRAIADGESIREYVEDTADAFNITSRIRFSHRVTSASWSSAAARWTVEAVGPGGETRRFACAFLFLASGYYDYSGGHRPHWPGEADFAGEIVHPQDWPEALDVAGKRIVVIGSGATAVTIVPALADRAAHVTMLQRTPSYIVARPSRDAIAGWLGRRLPASLAARLARWKNVLLGIYFFGRARKRPERARQTLLDLIRKDLGPQFVERDFSPPYNVWDQRLCLVPDGDLFAAIKAGRAAIVTDRIARFTTGGLALELGGELPADIVVTATGLVLQMLGGVAVSVDGEPLNPAERLVYKGMMLSGVPNLALAFGYTNASWTLKSDLTARYLCRLLRHMDRRGFAVCTPRPGGGATERKPMLEFSSGYVRRAEGVLPGQGARSPWRVHQNYLKDLAAMRFGRVDDGAMEFRAMVELGSGRRQVTFT